MLRTMEHGKDDGSLLENNTMGSLCESPGLGTNGSDGVEDGCMLGTTE